MLTARLVLVGCGKMGGTLLEGWLARGVEARHVTVVENAAAVVENLRRRLRIAVCERPPDLPPDLVPDAVVFAVKPQNMDEVVPAFRGLVSPRTVFLSIAAGKPIRYFASHLGDCAVVRSMPNTPAAVRRGMTVAFANARVSADQKRLCHDLLESVGEVAWIEDESLLDPVTAVSGNGPAYVCLLVECMTEAGIAAGLPADLAARLARVTVAGAGELLRLSPDPPAVLRENVTTPGGTSAASLAVLMAPDGLEPLMIRAVAAGTRRSRELGGS